MRQKYVISRGGANNRLKIREYAVTDSKLKKAAASILNKRDFTFLCEETYENEIVENSMSKGKNALIACLRTQNLFPIEPNASKIAESVIALYKSTEDDSMELLVDDVELLSI